jgi:DNA-binding winged helix-turn-helix (wHTH) protein
VLRYRFGAFVLSPRRRLLLRDGHETPLIPRYFDLLVFLIERRHEAVNRQQIFESVWTDVIVSDSALSQAIRTIRRTLGDDSREPRFIRTVSRHGYQFVHPELTEEPDADVVASADPVATDTVATHTVATAPEPTAPPSIEHADPFEPLLLRVARIPVDVADEEDQREAAELLHDLGIDEALRRLGTRPHHASARALLRDVRWDAAHAGKVPLLGAPSGVRASAALVRLRLRRAARATAGRWSAASLGAAAAGLFAGAAGGLLLVAAPGSEAPLAVVVVLAVIGAGCGAVAGAGVGAGISMAEAIARSQRTAAVVLAAAAGGGAIGGLVELIATWSLAALVGLRLAIGGGLEGVAIGGAAGLGYALATRLPSGGLAAPRGWPRARVALITAAACAVAGLALTLAGHALAGGTIHLIAQASHDAQVTLTPLGRLIGEPDFGRVSGAVIGTGEAALFGLGLAFGLTRRP